MFLAFSIFRPPATAGPLERDFEAYYAAGAAVDAGGDPYSRALWLYEARIPGVVAARDEVLPFVGPAATLPFWALLARMPYRVALAIWTVLLAGAFASVVLSALRIAGAATLPSTIAGALAFTFAAAPMLSDLALGQAALISAAAVAAALVTYRNRTAGMAIGATLLSAWQPNLALALIGRIRCAWDAVVMSAATLIFCILSLLAGGGVSGAFAYVKRLAEHGSAERFVTIQHTPAAIAYAFGAAPAYATLGGTIISLATIAIVGFVVRRERLGPTTATLVCCAALPLAIPFFHEHDFVLEICPLLVLGLCARGRARILATLAAACVLVDWFGLAQRHAAQGQIICLGFAVLFALVVIAPAAYRGRAHVAGFATIVLIAVVAVPLGRLHPAPTWPDALPSGFHAARTANISEVWLAESRAAGLLARDPVWATLRAIPLAGCIILTCALVADARDRRRRHRFEPTTSDMPPLRSPATV